VLLLAIIIAGMGKETIDDLVKFLLPYPDSVKAAALWLREFVWDLYHGIGLHSVA